MKKIIKPKSFEEAIYFSDFTGQPFDSNFRHPPVELKMTFNYGSIYDQSEVTLHLSDKDMGPILDLIQSKLNADYKKDLQQTLDYNNEELDMAMDSRDPKMCEYYISCNSLIRKLLGPVDSTDFISEDRDRG
jgi:hypothetical protein